MLPGAKLSNFASAPGNCSIFSGWRDQTPAWFAHEKSPFAHPHCSIHSHFMNSLYARESLEHTKKDNAKMRSTDATVSRQFMLVSYLMRAERRLKSSERIVWASPLVPDQRSRGLASCRGSFNSSSGSWPFRRGGREIKRFSTRIMLLRTIFADATQSGCRESTLRID